MKAGNWLLTQMLKLAVVFLNFLNSLFNSGIWMVSVQMPLQDSQPSVSDIAMLALKRFGGHVSNGMLTELSLGEEPLVTL